MQYLRQSTASQSVVIGPFVDEEDGVTPETGLTISNTDIRLSKNGANIVAKNSGGGTHDEIGYYTITLDATDTNTVGRLQLMVAESGALPVYHEFMVLEEAIFDALFASSATGALPVSSIANGAITANAIASNAITSAKIASNAIGSSQLATDAIGSAQIATSALTAIASAVWSATTRVLTAGTNIVLAKGTGVTGFNDVSTSDVQSSAAAALTAYDPPTKAEMDAGFSGLNDLDAAGVRSAVGLASANLDTQLSDLLVILESLDDRTQMIGGLAQGAGGGDNTLQLASGAVGADDRLNGWSIVTVSGSGAGQSRYITDSVAATDIITLDGDWEVAVDDTTRYIAFGN